MVIEAGLAAVTHRSWLPSGSQLRTLQISWADKCTGSAARGSRNSGVCYCCWRQLSNMSTCVCGVFPKRWLRSVNPISHKTVTSKNLKMTLKCQLLLFHWIGSRNCLTGTESFRGKMWKKQYRNCTGMGGSVWVRKKEKWGTDTAGAKG